MRTRRCGCCCGAAEQEGRMGSLRASTSPDPTAEQSQACRLCIQCPAVSWYFVSKIIRNSIRV